MNKKTILFDHEASLPEFLSLNTTIKGIKDTTGFEMILDLYNNGSHSYHMKVTVEERGVILFSCANLKNLLPDNTGTSFIKECFINAAFEAKQRGLNPAWAYVYYYLSPGQTHSVVDRLHETLTKIGFLSDYMIEAKNFIPASIGKKNLDILNELADEFPDPQQMADPMQFGYWALPISELFN